MTRRGGCTVCETGGLHEDLQTRWRVHGERQIYGSRWVEVSLVDVELPDGERFEHHVARLPSAVAVVVLDDAEQVRVTWRVDPGEDAAETAAREVEEETG